jgi:hypothetical protein
MVKRLSILGSLISLLIPHPTLYGIGFNDAIFPELATSGRALAMGNAFVNRVDDSSAVFYNPAGLGTVRYSHFHLSNFTLESNKGWVNLATGGKATDAASNFSNGFDLDGFRTLLVDTPGQRIHARYHVLPNLTTRYFSTGYLFARRYKGYLGVEAGDQFEYAYRQDHGPYAALNISLFGGVIKFGASAIMLSRNEYLGTGDPTVAVDPQDGDYNKGKALIVTAGGRIVLPITYLPTISYVLHNATDKAFTGRAAGSPTEIKQTVDVGFSITPQWGRSTRVHFEVNYKDLEKAYTEIADTRRVVAGMELDFSRVMYVRLGYGDGFGSFGLGIKSKRLEFDLTTYAVDTTGASYRGAEDRRFSMTVSSGF